MTPTTGFTVSARGARPLAQRADLPGWLRGARRTHLRIGSSLCSRLMPGAAALDRAVRLARDEGLALELATPVVGDAALEELTGTLIQLAEEAPDAEVAVNDWGVLRVLIRRGRSLRIVAGRLLHRQMRDPRLAALEPRDLGHDRWPPAWRWGSSSSPAWRELAAACGVTRFEIDWTCPGPTTTPPEGLDVSLHLPLTLVGLGRTCVDHGPAGPVDGYGGDGPCSRACEGSPRELMEMDVGGGSVELLREGRAELHRQPPGELERASRWLTSMPRAVRVVVSGEGA